jgi:methylthioribose-1-phosphate isomerase
VKNNVPAAVAWFGGIAGTLRILDQRLLPRKVRHIRPKNAREIAAAIKSLAVRGAPAIGIAAAYGVALSAVNSSKKRFTRSRAVAALKQDAELLRSARPTAVNLASAVDRMMYAAACSGECAPAELARILLGEAMLIHAEDRRMCDALGFFGAKLLPKKGAVLTHCNAGALATGGTGTALAAVYEAFRQGKKIRVFVDETRPLLQGARLTAWELRAAGVPCTLITDSMAGSVMAKGLVQAVITGADRIAANGDAANKIGTYALAVLAKYHGIPFYISAPATTFDLSIKDGSEIPIEERSADEVRCFAGRPVAPRGVDVFNPSFDVTPAELITAIITDRGIIKNPARKSIARLFRGG